MTLEFLTLIGIGFLAQLVDGARSRCSNLPNHSDNPRSRAGESTASVREYVRAVG
jgi:hypothetical protein